MEQLNNMEISATLPYPKKISVNHCYKIGKRGVFLSSTVKKFRADVYHLLCTKKGFGEALIKLEIKMYPPDKRIRDIDNILKVTLDALQYANMYKNDSQIIQLHIEKLKPIKGGKLDIVITNLQKALFLPE